MRAAMRAAIVLVVILVACPALAGEPQCVTAYEDAQVLRRTGKLRAARDAALICARAVCPEVARRDCAGWVETIQKELPTVVVTVRDDADHEVVARVLVDGAPRDISDGRPFEIDPGTHVFRAERAEGPAAETTLTFLQGEHERVARLIFERPKPPVITLKPLVENEKHASPSSPRVTAFVVLGASLAVLGTSLYLGLTGRSDLDDLRTSCAPTCSDNDVDPIRRKLMISDVTLGVGLLGALAGLYLYLHP